MKGVYSRLIILIKFHRIFVHTVNLVERNTQPGGMQMVNAHHVGHHSATDIVELAREINQADEAIRNVATGKLSLILEQVSVEPNQISVSTPIVLHPFIHSTRLDPVPASASQKSARGDDEQQEHPCGGVQLQEDPAQNVSYVPP